MFWRSWVQISTPYAAWTFSHWFVAKIMANLKKQCDEVQMHWVLYWTVVVVKWSACSPSTPPIPQKSTIFCNIIEKNEYKQKGAMVGPFEKWSSHQTMIFHQSLSLAFIEILFNYHKISSLPWEPSYLSGSICTNHPEALGSIHMHNICAFSI